MHPLHFRLCLSVLLFTCMNGCGSSEPSVTIPELGQVTGTVKLNGEPLAGALVVFEPPELSPESRESRAMTGPDGTYELVYVDDVKGAVIGTHTVRISKMGENEQSILPNEYHAESKQTRDVQAGSNTFDFDLQVR